MACPTPSLEHISRLLENDRRLTKLVLSFDSSSQATEVLSVLRQFECLEELKITFKDARSTLEMFPRIETLQRVTIKNVTLSKAALDSLATNTTLRSLRLKNVQYVRALNVLSHLANLRRLEVSGHIPVLSENIDFLNSMLGLEEVFLEMGMPRERVLETLSTSPATVSLKLRGCCINTFASKLSRISNLTDLIFITPCCLIIPPCFQDLSRLRSVSFMDQTDLRTPNVDLVNLPPTVTNVSLDLKWIHLKEDPFPDALALNITCLTIQMPIIGKLGMNKFTNLQFLDLRAKELDSVLFRELKQLHFLKELKVAGCPNITNEMLSHLAQIPLELLSIANAHITRDTFCGIQSLSNLKTLAFHACFFSNLNLDCLPSLPNLKALILDRCTPVEEHLIHIISSPFIGKLKSVEFGLSSFLLDDQRAELYAKQLELGLEVSIQYYENV